MPGALSLWFMLSCSFSSVCYRPRLGSQVAAPAGTSARMQPQLEYPIAPLHVDTAIFPAILIEHRHRFLREWISAAAHHAQFGVQVLHQLAQLLHFAAHLGKIGLKGSNFSECHALVLDGTGRSGGLYLHGAA